MQTRRKRKTRKVWGKHVNFTKSGGNSKKYEGNNNFAEIHVGGNSETRGKF